VNDLRRNGLSPELRHSPYLGRRTEENNEWFEDSEWYATQRAVPTVKAQPICGSPDWGKQRMIRWQRMICDATGCPQS